MKDLVLKLKDEGKTVVLCSHLLADVQDVCDRIAIVDAGALQVVGPMKELLTLQDTVEILAKKLPEGSWDEVKEALKQKNVEILTMDHPTTTLEELFLKTVGRKDKDA